MKSVSTCRPVRLLHGEMHGDADGLLLFGIHQLLGAVFKSLGAVRAPLEKI